MKKNVKLTCFHRFFAKIKSLPSILSSYFIMQPLENEVLNSPLLDIIYTQNKKVLKFGVPHGASAQGMAYTCIPLEMVRRNVLNTNY